MSEHMDRLTPEQLAAIRRRVGRFETALQGGSDGEAMVAAMATACDVIPLLSEVEALREHIAELRTASLHRLIGLVPSGELRNRLAEVVAEEQRRTDAQEGRCADG